MYASSVFCSTSGLIYNRIDASLRLRRAIHLHNLPLVRRILKAHPHLIHNSDQSPLGLANTSLHLACQLDNLEIVELLLNLGHESKNISLNTLHQTPLMIASSLGHVEIVNHICSTGDLVSGIARRDVKGRDAVMLAAQKGYDTCVQIILTFAPPPTRTFNALHPELSNHQIDQLSNTEALLMNQDCDGNTALHHACANGFINVARTLIAAGADPDRRNGWNWAPVNFCFNINQEVRFKKLVDERDKALRSAKEARASWAESHTEMEMGEVMEMGGGLGLGMPDLVAMKGRMGVRIVSQPD